MTNYIKLQKESIEKVVDILKSYKEVEAIFIMGSHARGEESSFSDIDIGFVFSDPKRPKRNEIFESVASLQPTLCTLWLFDKQGLFLFENGTRLDLDFLTEGDMDNWDLSNVENVYDPKGKYKSSQATSTRPNTAPKPKWRNEDGNMIDWFFWMFRQTYCYIRRGETNEKRSFDKLYSAQNSLRSIREKLIEIRIYLNGKWEYMSIIDKEFAYGISTSFTSFDPVEMKKATKLLFNIFEKVTSDYCKKESLEFPEYKIKVMKKLFDEFDKQAQ